MGSGLGGAALGAVGGYLLGSHTGGSHTDESHTDTGGSPVQSVEGGNGNEMVPNIIIVNGTMLPNETIANGTTISNETLANETLADETATAAAVSVEYNSVCLTIVMLAVVGRMFWDVFESVI